MKLLFENWRSYVKEAEEADDIEGAEGPESNVLDLSGELDSGFCEFNPLINQYAQSSPEGMAEMLIFVVATQRSRWYDVVDKFPILMAYIREKNMLLDPENSYIDDKGKRFFNLPKGIGQLVLGFRKKAIQTIWEDQDRFYAEIMPIIDKFNNAGQDTIAQEEAQFEIYLKLMTVPGLGLPKAAFASQLVIGRLGCIDSINMNLYKGLDPEGKLITVSDKGLPSFKTPGKKKSGGKIISLTKGGIKLAEKYVEFLKHIAKMTQTADISRQLWDSWVEMVAKKINVGDDLTIILPGDKKFIVPNDYSRRRSKEYLKGRGKATGKDVSREHDPRQLSESQRIWNDYFYGVLKG
jgi:hypothetical protein